MQHQLIVLLAEQTEPSMTFVGGILAIGGIVGILFSVFGPVNRPDVRGSLSLKRHVRAKIFDVLGPKGVRWLGSIVGGIIVLVGIGMVGYDCCASDKPSSPNVRVQRQALNGGREKYLPNNRVVKDSNGKDFRNAFENKSVPPISADSLGKPDVALPLVPVEGETISQLGIIGHLSEDEAINSISKNGGMLVGAVLTIDPGGFRTVSSIQPIYQVGDHYEVGPQLGEVVGATKTVIAKPGFAVAGIGIHKGIFLDNMQFVFKKVEDGKFAKNAESYTSEWYGNDKNSGLVTIETEQSPVIGLVTNRKKLQAIVLLGVSPKQDFLSEKDNGELEQIENPEVTPFANSKDRLENSFEVQESEESSSIAIDSLGKPKMALPLVSLEGKTIAQVGVIGHLKEGETVESISEKGGILVGAVLTIDSGGFRTVTSIQPIYQIGDRYEVGSLLGEAVGPTETVLAKPGFAVAGIGVHQGLFLDNMVFLFKKIENGEFAKDAESYTSKWYGNDKSNGLVTIETKQSPVVGLTTNREKLQAIAILGVRPGINSQGTNRETVSEVLGSMHDTKFEEIGPNGSLLVGIQVTYTPESHHPLISSIQPLFRDKDGSYIKGKVYGLETKQKEHTFAKKGYAVGGIHARVGLLFDGIEVVYMKVENNKLNPKEQYQSKWFGNKTGGSPEEIISSGAPIVGIRGAYREELTGLQLVYE